MSYTFTSKNKNYANNEDLSHSPQHRDRLNEIFKNSKTILMVGWRYDSDFSFVDFMIEESKDLTIVEIYEPNTKNVRKEVTIHCSDILDFDIEKEYDLLLWQHGPEHVFKSEVLDFVKKVSDKFKHIVFETPYGHNPQGEMYGNIYETHVSEWEEKDYTDLGFNYVKYAGVNNDAFIIGYK
jgi:uncharacterized protein YciI